MIKLPKSRASRPIAHFWIGVGALCLGVAAAPPGDSSAVQEPRLSYADLADLALTAPVVVHARVDEAIRLKDERAAGVRPGHARFYVEADLISLIRGAEGVPTRIRYVVDLPAAASGKTPRLRRGTEYILLAKPVSGRPGELQLVAPDAQLPWTEARLSSLRSILTEATGSSAPPRITGIGRAFHVPGSIPGESETQIFLLAGGGVPVSLNILRRPNMTPAWSVALSEIVDDAAAAPRPESLLWYRLACSLPRTLPAHSVADAGPDAANAIRADYAFVLGALGSCVRHRAQR